MNKLKVGDRFAMGRFDFTIDEVGPEDPLKAGAQHYRISWYSDAGARQAGWIPVFIVDNFTGHLAK